jgi:hypothetical protein
VVCWLGAGRLEMSSLSFDASCQVNYVNLRKQLPFAVFRNSSYLSLVRSGSGSSRRNHFSKPVAVWGSLHSMKRSTSVPEMIETGQNSIVPSLKRSRSSSIAWVTPGTRNRPSVSNPSRQVSSTEH